MYTQRTLHGIGIAAAVAGLLATGCGGRSAGPALPTAQQASPKIPDSARFEAFRASTEQQVRRLAPAGSVVTVASTYLVRRGNNTVVFSDRNVAMKAAGARAGITEVPQSFFVTAAKGRQVSTVHPICSPDNCPDQPPPDPTPGPDGVYEAGDGVISDGATTEAQSRAATRTTPCSQTFTTNGYPGGVSMSFLGGTTWDLTYTPGYPYFTGGVDTADITESVRLVDGSTFTSTSQALLENNAVNRTIFSYTGGNILTVKYAMIQVIEHPYPGDNLIVGQAQVTCAGDSNAIRGIAPIQPPIIEPPHWQWWRTVLE